MSEKEGKRGKTGMHGNHATGRRVQYIAIACVVCGTVREYSPGTVKVRKNIKFCSKTCDAKYRTVDEAHVHVLCSTCGSSFYKDRHRLCENNYCSKECASKGISKRLLIKYHGSPEAKAKWKDLDQIREYQREYQKRNREKINALSSKWGKRNREKKNANQRARRGSGGYLPAVEWKIICERFHNRCVCCLKKTNLTMDHIVPVSIGGMTSVENAQPLCAKCNSKKGTKEIDYRADFLIRYEAQADEGVPRHRDP